MDMKLYIDTSNSDKLLIKIDGNEYSSKMIDRKSQALLPFIVETLEKENKKLEEISNIEINPGPGSFTGLRVGFAVANALSWSLGLSDVFTEINYS